MRVSLTTIKKMIREAIQEQSAEDPSSPTPVGPSNVSAGGGTGMRSDPARPGGAARRIVGGDLSPEEMERMLRDEQARQAGGAPTTESFNRKLRKMVREAVAECMGLDEQDAGALPTGSSARPMRTPPAMGASLPGGRVFTPGGSPEGVARQGSASATTAGTNTVQTPVTSEAAIRRMVRKIVRESLRSKR